MPLRQRPDLIVRPHWLGRRRYWVVKDPLALEYHQLGDDEHAVLRMLDGRVSLEEIQARYAELFAPERLSLSRLQALLGVFHRQGLAIAETSGQGEQILVRHHRQQRQRLLAAFGNVLAIRLPGIAPQRFLNWLYPRASWFFSPACVAACLCLVVAALTLVSVQYQTVLARLPELQSFFIPRNLLLLALTLGPIKVLHELGHALTCKRFGGECHEIGVMFLVFTPCLYCNVTDSWTIASKWRRIAIAVAGIYVEVVIASICTFLWWFSEPGLLNSLCLNAMVICSLNTLLLNGNPLLRYDGYFVLSDLLEIPNLWQLSRAAVVGLARRLCLGIETEIDRLLPSRGRGWLLAYGVASMLYRILVVAMILLFLYNLLKPHALESVAVFIALTVLASLILMPMVQVSRFVQDPTIRRRVNGYRLATTCGLASAVLAGLFLVPMPMRVRVPVVIEARDAQRVYVTQPGTLIRTIPAGTRVEAGESLALLESPVLHRRIANLEGEIRRSRIRLQNLVTVRALGLDAAAEVAPHIPATEESLADKLAQLEQLQADQQRLELRAALPGIVMAPPDVGPSTEERELPFWSATPLDSRNLGCHLEAGTLFCLVGDPGQYEAVAYLKQADVAFVQVGQDVRLLLDQLAGRTLRGTVRELAKVDAKVVPPQLLSQLDLPIRQDPRGLNRPLEALYEVRISLAGIPTVRGQETRAQQVPTVRGQETPAQQVPTVRGQETPARQVPTVRGQETPAQRAQQAGRETRAQQVLVVGAGGRAKIHVAPKPWGQRLVRALSEAFTFQL